MRVITGSAKGRKLRMVPGEGTRPITDRAKEALFSILDDWILDAHILDLFGGTGAVGIEALSRGATKGQFVDLNRQAVQTILANLKTCDLAARAQVQRLDSFKFLEKYSGPPFDLLYVAPPQYQELWIKALKQIDERPDLLVDPAIVIVQIHPREDVPVELTHLEEYDRRQYGSVLLIFYTNEEEVADDVDDVDEEGHVRESS